MAVFGRPGPLPVLPVVLACAVGALLGLAARPAPPLEPPGCSLRKALWPGTPLGRPLPFRAKVSRGFRCWFFVLHGGRGVEVGRRKLGFQTLESGCQLQTGIHTREGGLRSSNFSAPRSLIPTPPLAGGPVNKWQDGRAPPGIASHQVRA